jgi:prepilin-type N-terminal cleavage/methylation domain-containing protein
MKNFRKNKKGFTLLEVLVAVGLFSLISVAVVGIFANVMKTSNEIRTTQKKVELAGTTIESMAKIIRMSDNVGYNEDAPLVGDWNIYIRNTSQKKCINYNFNSNRKELSVRDFIPGDPGECAVPGNYSVSSLTVLLSDVDVFCDSILSTDTIAGKTTISVKIGNRSLQTTVSFLDYQK